MECAKSNDSVLVRGIRLLLTISFALVGAAGWLSIRTSSVAWARAKSDIVSPERPQPGWAVASSTRRGVVVDYKMESVAGLQFRVIRLRARTALLRWHVGSQDPPVGALTIPADAAPRINWPNEGMAGVVAVFNGGFKVGAHAGGSMVDGLTLSPMVRGDMTIALDAFGHWRLGVWGPGFPGAHFHLVAARQNLGPLVANGKVVTSALYGNPYDWGAPLTGRILEPRTALGVDVKGNLIYLASVSGSEPRQLGEALVAAGAVAGMELDMNPYWPILGASFGVLHAPNVFPVQIPYASHNPTIYTTGWERDFFVAMAEPSSWNCEWASAGLRSSNGLAQPQILHGIGSGCVPAIH